MGRPSHGRSASYHGAPQPRAPHCVFWAALGPGGQGIFDKNLGTGAFLKFSLFLGILIKMADILAAYNIYQSIIHR